MRTMGKPGKSTARRKLSDEQIQRAATMRALGETYKQIGDCLGVSRDTVSRALRRREQAAFQRFCVAIETSIEKSAPQLMTRRSPIMEALVRAQGQPEAAPRQPWWRRALDRLREALRAFVAGGIR